MHVITPPTSIQTLLKRAEAISGWTLNELASAFSIEQPASLLRQKGWVGQLLEQALGTDAGNRAKPDFTALGIELKTIPMDQTNKPTESTYVSVVPLLGSPGLTWETSDVRAKLDHVLWVPIEADKSIPLPKRRIGRSILWKMPLAIETQLKADWEELMEYVLQGRLSEISARLGHYLHIRPKAANHKALTYGWDPNGDKILTLPRGFYLRPQFTHQILNNDYQG